MNRLVLSMLLALILAFVPGCDIIEDLGIGPEGAEDQQDQIVGYVDQGSLLVSGKENYEDIAPGLSRDSTVETGCEIQVYWKKNNDITGFRQMAAIIDLNGSRSVTIKAVSQQNVSGSWSLTGRYITKNDQFFVPDEATLTPDSSLAMHMDDGRFDPELAVVSTLERWGLIDPGSVKFTLNHFDVNLNQLIVLSVPDSVEANAIMLNLADAYDQIWGSIVFEIY